MNKFLPLAIALLVPMLHACKDEPNQPTHTETKQETPVQSPPMSFEMKSFERKGGECKDEFVRCIKIKLQYPEAKGGNEQSRRQINQFVHEILLESILPDPNEHITTLDEAAVLFVKYYQDQLAEFPDYEMGWEVDVDGSAEIVDHFAVIRLAAYSNTGGAHPNHNLTIANFDLESGKELKLMDIVTDAKAFSELAQKRFIEARISDYDLDEVNIDDFFFGEGFQLPENFALTSEGVFFYYNPYEAAPYALGTTEFTIPFDDLKGIVKL